MQSKSKLILMCLFVNSFCYSQRHLEYYRLINDANIAVCDSNYHLACIKYDSAHKQKDYMKAKDAHNAIICYNLCNQIDKAVNLSVELISLGADSTYFYSNGNMKNMINSKEWKSSVLDKHILGNKHNWKIDTALRSELIKRYIKDQDVNNPNRKLFFSENSKWFQELLLKDSFPTQRKVGIFTDSSKISADLYEVMLVHYFDNLKRDRTDRTNQLKFDSLKLAGLLFKLVERGEISPSYFASLNNVGVYYQLMISQMYFIVAGNSVFIVDKDEEALNTINSKRSCIGLPTVNIQMKIIRANAFDKRFQLFSGSVTGIMPKEMEEDFKPPFYKNIGNKKDILNMK